MRRSNIEAENEERGRKANRYFPGATGRLDQPHPLEHGGRVIMLDSSLAGLPASFLSLVGCVRRWGCISLQTNIVASAGLTVLGPLLLAARTQGNITAAIELWFSLYLLDTGAILLVQARLGEEKNREPSSRERLYLPTRASNFRSHPSPG